jgi:hypothetical protein
MNSKVGSHEIARDRHDSRRNVGQTLGGRPALNYWSVLAVRPVLELLLSYTYTCDEHYEVGGRA